MITSVPHVALEKIADVSAGNPAPQGAKYFSASGLPFVRMQDVGRDHINPSLIETTDKITESAVEECRLRLYPAGTLLIPKSGASVNLNHRAMLGESAYVVSHLATIVPDKSQIDPSYLFHWSTSYDPRKQAQVTSLPSLPLSLITQAQVPLPPMEEQRRIVALLDRAAEIRRRAEAARDKARSIIPALFVDMFGDPATLSQRFSAAEMGKIIADKQLGLVRSTRDQPENGAYGYVRMNAITTDGRVVLDGLRRTNASEKDATTSELRNGDLLFNTRNSRELVGKMGIYRGPSGNLFNNNIMRIRMKKYVLPEFVNAYFQCSEGRSAIEAIKKGTTSVCAVYYKDLEKLQLPVPPLERQSEFVRIAQRSDRIQANISTQENKANSINTALSAEVFA